MRGASVDAEDSCVIRAAASRTAERSQEHFGCYLGCGNGGFRGADQSELALTPPRPKRKN
jgi:hypothetical protein